MKVAIVCFNGLERNGEYTFLKHLDTSMMFDTIIFNRDRNLDKIELSSKIYIDSENDFEKISNNYDVIIVNNGFLKFDKSDYTCLDSFSGKLGFVCHGLVNERFYGFDNLRKKLDFMFVFSDEQENRYKKELSCYRILLPFNEKLSSYISTQPKNKVVSVVTRMSTVKKVNEVIDLWITEKIPYKLRLFKGKQGLAWENQIVSCTGKTIKQTLQDLKTKNITIENEYSDVTKIYSESALVIDNSFIELEQGRIQYTVLEAFSAKVPILVNTKWSSEINKLFNIRSLTKENIVELIEDVEEQKSYKEQMNKLLQVHKAINCSAIITKAIYEVCYES